ncbi:MAG: bile acid:sodium symporter family protein [Bacteroidetes bacterium]|nr:bile acid:sodium symporter family protein [Bacteroidota bacterium]
MLEQAQINFNNDSIGVLNIALAFVMFGIALSIDWRDFKPVVLKPKALIVGVASQFLIFPLISFLLVLFLKPVPSIALGMILVAACPGGNISNFITHFSRGNDALSVSLTAIATLLAVVMTPLNLAFWGNLYEPTSVFLKSVSVEPIEMVKLVGLILGVPLVLGMFIHEKFPLFALRTSIVMKKLSLLFFIALIFLALGKNLEAFERYVMEVFWLVLLHNFVAFATGFSLAKWWGLSWKDTKTITIETGIQNSGLGLLLIFTFFDGLGGMAILTAFWGIWHLISGLLLGTFLRNYPTLNEEVYE